ncbi:MAG: helix-turn-helix domain-containing protein [Clostridia bacterium]|nr:helix-turn-helix domain-containing protein [Clostridia bacterium]
MIENKLVLTISEASKLTGIGRDTLYKLINSNRYDFPYFKVKSRAYINKSMLEKWLFKISNENVTIE